jgi:DNA-binding response OmpR family regulator
VRESGLIEEALNAGADEYLTKPISENILIAHLNTLSRRSREEKDAKNRLFQDMISEDARSQPIK